MLFRSVMGRRRTPEDYQQIAEENGWVPGAHEEEDSIQQAKGEHSDRYKGARRKPWISGQCVCSTLPTGLLKGSSPLATQNADRLHVVLCRHRVCTGSVIVMR